MLGVMKTKDYLIVMFAPLAVLVIPLIGNLTSPSDWKWTWHDFVTGWVILALTTFIFRLLLTRKWSNLPYKLGASLGVAAGFLVTWSNLAVQIIGDDNPAFVLYFVALLIGLVGIGVARFEPAGMARAAFATAAALFVIPIIALICWPVDFSPGVLEVFGINSAFVAMFATSGLLFRHAARRSDTDAALA
jgi:hypothetical protein